MQRERAELEQNYAREIGNLVQRLSAEKAELEAELRLKMDQEVIAVRWVVMSLKMRQAYWPEVGGKGRLSANRKCRWVL